MTDTVRSSRYPIDRRAQRIMAAAFTEFSQRGIRAARMSVIARRAGVSPATLRQYFPTTDDLFREVFRSALAPVIPQPRAPSPDQALITYAVWFTSPGVYGSLTGPDRHRAKEAVIDFLVQATRPI